MYLKKLNYSIATKSRNFIGTLNNPDVTLTEFSDLTKQLGATTFAG